MNIRVVSSRDEILLLSPNERVVHIAFRPSNKDVFLLVETCPRLEVIQLPKSYKRTVSRAIEMFLEMQNVQLLEGDVWGHRKDLNEYYIMPSTIITKIKNMKAEGISDEGTAKKVAEEHKINSKMVYYILNKRLSK
jgi:hypothetical protein